MTCRQHLSAAQNTEKFTTRKTIMKSWPKFTSLQTTVNSWPTMEALQSQLISQSKNTHVISFTITTWVWKNIIIKTSWWRLRREASLLRAHKINSVATETTLQRKALNSHGNPPISYLFYWWLAAEVTKTLPGNTKSHRKRMESRKNPKLSYRNKLSI